MLLIEYRYSSPPTVVVVFEMSVFSSVVLAVTLAEGLAVHLSTSPP